VAALLLSVILFWRRAGGWHRRRGKYQAMKISENIMSVGTKQREHEAGDARRERATTAVNSSRRH